MRVRSPPPPPIFSLFLICYPLCPSIFFLSGNKLISKIIPALQTSKDFIHHGPDPGCVWIDPEKKVYGRQHVMNIWVYSLPSLCVAQEHSRVTQNEIVLAFHRCNILLLMDFWRGGIKLISDSTSRKFDELPEGTEAVHPDTTAHPIRNCSRRL